MAESAQNDFDAKRRLFRNVCLLEEIIHVQTQTHWMTSELDFGNEFLWLCHEMDMRIALKGSVESERCRSAEISYHRSMRTKRSAFAVCFRFRLGSCLL